MMKSCVVLFKAETCTAVLLAMTGISSMAVATSRGYSHVGLTKLASLHVASMESDQLFSSQANDLMTTSACLQARGEPIPYRVSASSHKGKSAFTVASDTTTERIRYDVTWSGLSDNFLLSTDTDLTDVLRAEASGHCQLHALSITLDDQGYESASPGTYTDTLSLILVIE